MKRPGVGLWWSLVVMGVASIARAQAPDPSILTVDRIIAAACARSRVSRPTPSHARGPARARASSANRSHLEVIGGHVTQVSYQPRQTRLGQRRHRATSSR